MNARTIFGFGFLLAGGLFLSSCKPPKHVPYTSIHKDFRCTVPWGWDVITDEEGTHYANTTFIGTFDPDFHLGAPSLSVRWYAYSYPHRLPDGLLETYSSAEDFVEQTLEDVYGPQRHMRQEPREVELPAAGLKAKNFVVLSPAPVPAGTRWGIVADAETKRPVNLREHAYAILAMNTGFYVIVYPATREGFKRYEGHFNTLVKTFVPLKEGPGGPLLELPAPLVKAVSANQPK